MGARLLSRPPPQTDYQGCCFIQITNKLTLSTECIKMCPSVSWESMRKCFFLKNLEHIYEDPFERIFTYRKKGIKSHEL
jgi:hypothetical protein